MDRNCCKFFRLYFPLADGQWKGFFELSFPCVSRLPDGRISCGVSRSRRVQP